MSDSFVKEINERVDKLMLKNEKEQEQELKKAMINNTTIFNTNEEALGQILGEDSEPMPGATIQIKGSNIGVASDVNGNFKLTISKPEIIIISAIGYNTLTAVIVPGKRIVFTLSASSNNLDEVVVVGYGVNKRKEMDGALAFSKVTEGLSGAVAGVAIRGLGSVKNDNDKIFIYNGNVVLEKDIEALGLVVSEKLSGDAAAIYGAQDSSIYLLVAKNGENDNPKRKVRKDFTDVAYWQSKLKTNAIGEASFKATMPDNITTWTTSHFAYTKKQKTGIGQGTFKSLKTLFGELIYPEFVIENDSFYVQNKIRNLTGNPKNLEGTFQLNDKPTGIKNNFIIQKITFDSTLIYFDADSAKVTYSLSQNGKKLDVEVQNLQIFKAGNIEKQGKFIMLKPDSSFVFDAQYANQNIKIKVNNQIKDWLKTQIDELKNYPYECNEQLASKLMAYLVEEKIDPTKANKTQIKRLIKKLVDTQNKQDQWSWWGGDVYSEWVTGHVIHVLEKAKAAGHSVDLKTEQFNTKLKYWHKNVNSINELLYLKKIFPQQTIKHKIENINLNNKLDSLLTLAELQLTEGDSSSLAIIQSHLLPDLLDGMYLTNDKNSFNYYGSNSILLSAKALYLFGNIPKYELTSEKIYQYLLNSQIKGAYLNTFYKAKVLEAIAHFVMFKNYISESQIYFDINGESFFTNKKTLDSTINYKQKVIFKNNSKNLLFVNLYQEFFNKNPKSGSDDILVKSYFSEGNNTLKKGEKTILKVEVKNSKLAEYALLEIPIPAGCRYFQKQSNYFSNDYSEQYKQKTLIPIYNLKPGMHMYEIELMPSFTGTFTLNPARFELMYFPFVNGVTNLKKISIK